MTSILLYDDIPCAYPSTLTAATKTGIGNTPNILCAFKHDNADYSNVFGYLQRFDFKVYGASDDTLVTFQFAVAGPATGGTWSEVGGGSILDVNLTATDFTVNRAALTMYSFAVAGQGVSPTQSTLTNIDASSLGLTLRYGQQFAIYAYTEATGATVDVAWTFNWVEKD